MTSQYPRTGSLREIVGPLQIQSVHINPHASRQHNRSPIFEGMSSLNRGCLMCHNRSVAIRAAHTPSSQSWIRSNSLFHPEARCYCRRVRNQRCLAITKEKISVSVFLPNEHSMDDWFAAVYTLPTAPYCFNPC